MHDDVAVLLLGTTGHPNSGTPGRGDSWRGSRVPLAISAIMQKMYGWFKV